MEAKIGFAGHNFCTTGFIFQLRIYFSRVPIQHPSETLKLVNIFKNMRKRLSQ